MPILNDALAALDTIKEADINYISGKVGINYTSPPVELWVGGRAVVSNGQTAKPTPSAWGGEGARIVYWGGADPMGATG